MPSLWEDVKNAILDGYVYAADKADELTQIGRAKMDILRVNRSIAHEMSEIGGRVFELFETDQEADTATDADILKSVKDIRKMHKEIDKLKREIEHIRAEKAKKATAQKVRP